MSDEHDATPDQPAAPVPPPPPFAPPGPQSAPPPAAPYGAAPPPAAPYGAAPPAPMPLQAPPPSGPQAPPPSGPQQPPRKRRTGLWIGVAAAAVVLVAAVTAVLVLYRPSFEVTAIEAPDEVVAGDDVVMTIDVRNEGLRAGELELTALVDGRPDEATVVEVGAGEQERVRITLRDLPAGTHRLALADWDELAGSVWVMTPADIVVDYLVVEPNPIDVRTETEATVLVGLSNLGEAPGRYDLALLLDGEPADGRGVDVAGGDLVEEAFTVVIDSAGDHEVTVGDVTEPVRAHSVRRPGNGDELVNSIGGGSNQLRITNNGDQDVLIVLAEPGDDQPAVLSVYVRAGGSTTVNRLRSGTYSTYYVFGADWCTHFEEFTQLPMAGRFDEDITFESTATYYTTYTLEMGVSEGESAPTQHLPPEDIPSM